MCYFLRKTLQILFVILILVSRGICQKTEHQVTDWSNPQNINPLDPEIGDFLDTNLSVFSLQAADEFKNKHYFRAAQYYLFLLRHQYNDNLVMYKLASCYAQLEEEELAARYLYRAFDAGFTNVNYFRQDKNFDAIREKSKFKKVAESLLKWGDSYGSTVFFEAEVLIPCRIHLPAKFDRTKRYPLLVGLHGYSGNAEDFSSLYRYLPDPEFIYVSLRAPYQIRPMYGNKAEQFSWGVRYGDNGVMKRGDELVIGYVENAIKTIQKKYHIGNVFLMGFSQGTAFTYITGLKRPALFKGLICFGGSLPDLKADYSILSEKDITNGSSLKIFISHGKQDRAVNYQRGMQTVETLKKHGYDVTFYGFEGGHIVPPEALKRVAEWMKMQK